LVLICLNSFEKAIESALTSNLLTSIHLYSDLDDELEANGDINYVYIFSAIALFILLLACINFMNSIHRRIGRALQRGRNPQSARLGSERS
jgi:hypothetical protein